MSIRSFGIVKKGWKGDGGYMEGCSVHIWTMHKSFKGGVLMFELDRG
jgi:hypothetical protein